MATLVVSASANKESISSPVLEEVEGSVGVGSFFVRGVGSVLVRGRLLEAAGSIVVVIVVVVARFRSFS